MKLNSINALNLNCGGKKINKKQIIAALAGFLLAQQAKAQDIYITNPYHTSQPTQQYMIPYFVVQETPAVDDEELQIYNPYRTDNPSTQYMVPYYLPTTVQNENAYNYNPIYTYPQVYTQQQISYYPTPTPMPAPKVDSRAPIGSDFYYAILQYGDKYEIQAHYDSGKNGAGAYYQYGNQAFSKKDGKRIQNPEKLYGFTPININNTQSQNPTYPAYPTYPVYPTPVPAPKVDSRAPNGSDFYYTILRFGDKYKIQAHYDAGGGIGSYYQYGPYAFDKEGKRIQNPEKLWGFDKNIK